MSARSIFDHAPLGAIIQYSDCTPRPPERHRRKLQDWQRRNSSGRLMKKHAATCIGQTIIPASFTLDEGDFGSESIIVLKLFKTFSVGSDLTFTVTERPVTGSILIFDRSGDQGELVHVAAGMKDAEDWLSRHGYPNAILQTVNDEPTDGDPVEGRAA